jgi:hypothetical protein
VIDLTRIFFSWQILLVAGCLLIIFPVIFLVSSLDKTPVKIKRVKLARRVKPAVKKDAARGRAADEDIHEPRRDDRRTGK